MTDDMALVREFAANASEAAFEMLVARHINVVYSTALRRVSDAHLAEEDHPGRLHHSGAQGRLARLENDSFRLALSHRAVRRCRFIENPTSPATT